MVSQNYRALLEDENLKRWYQNTARDSKVTADVYLRRLGNYQKKGNRPQRYAGEGYLYPKHESKPNT